MRIRPTPMEWIRNRALITGSIVIMTGIMLVRTASAEWYVAGQFGGNFADQLNDIRGSGSLSGFRAPDFDLKNSFVFGGKVGVYPGNGWFGVELDAFHSTPHIKNLDDVPGVHMRVTNIGINLLARYPGVTFQPYVGIGTGAVIARIGNSATTQGSTDVSSGLNLLAGIRAFVTPYMAVFTEYKYTQSTFEFSNAFGQAGGFNGDYRAQVLVFGVSYHF